MKKMNFKWLILICMAMGVTNMAIAQIAYSSTDYFYTEIGKTASSLRYAVKFRSDAVWLKEVSYSKARENLSKNSMFYEDEDWTDKGTESYYIWNQGSFGKCDRKFTYCPSLSTSTRIVYKRHVEYSYYHPMQGIMNATAGYGCVKTTSDSWGGKTFYYNYDMYVAFSPDKSSFIFWKEKSYNPDGKIDGKATYTVVPKSELLPKSANRDFLND